MSKLIPLLKAWHPEMKVSVIFGGHELNYKVSIVNPVLQMFEAEDVALDVALTSAMEKALPADAVQRLIQEALYDRAPRTNYIDGAA